MFCPSMGIMLVSQATFPWLTHDRPFLLLASWMSDDWMKMHITHQWASYHLASTVTDIFIYLNFIFLWSIQKLILVYPASQIVLIAEGIASDWQRMVDMKSVLQSPQSMSCIPRSPHLTISDKIQQPPVLSYCGQDLLLEKQLLGTVTALDVTLYQLLCHPPPFALLIFLSWADLQIIWDLEIKPVLLLNYTHASYMQPSQ